MLNFCTLFDSYYMSRGLTMYESLIDNCKEAHLYIFAFDDESYNFLESKKLSKATIISLQEFENEKLLGVKKDRTKGEYCWTATGSTIKYCLKHFNISTCTYLDADLYFYNSPDVLLQEVANGYTLITEHRYTKKYDQSKSSGKFCVQFMTFHNNVDSIKVLDDWIDDCIDWCYARAENGKFGDQKYLDYWQEKYPKIHILKHLGGGLAPWNIQQYKVKKENNTLYGVDSNDEKFEIIFYHFHALKLLENNNINLAPYKLETDVIGNLYIPYLKHLLHIGYETQITLNSNRKLDIKYIIKRILNDKGLLFRVLKQKYLEEKNIYNLTKLLGEN